MHKCNQSCLFISNIFDLRRQGPPQPCETTNEANSPTSEWHRLRQQAIHPVQPRTSRHKAGGEEKKNLSSAFVSPFRCMAAVDCIQEIWCRQIHVCMRVHTYIHIYNDCKYVAKFCGSDSRQHCWHSRIRLAAYCGVRACDRCERDGHT